jgi:rRNA processing protein Krr1/Pno1
MLNNTPYDRDCVLAAKKFSLAIANGEDIDDALDVLSTNYNVERNHIEKCFFDLVNEARNT